MYQQRANGSYRMRASFRVTTVQVEGLNVICRRTGLSFAEVCSKAVDKLIADYVRDRQFVYPDVAPVLTDSTPLEGSDELVAPLTAVGVAPVLSR